MKPVRSAFLPVIGSIAAILALAMLFYLGDKIETIEDQLRYQPAAAGEFVGGGFAVDKVAGQTVYVPVYSHVYAGGGEPHLLETTLSIRNTDPGRSIALSSVRYYDTKGALVQSLLEGVIELAPLETTEFLIKKQDARGGSGANFIVEWKAAEEVYEPIIEAVMVGLNRQQSISLKSVGRPLVNPQE